MKKTISVNISGIIFNIEEDAYNKLKVYLSTIKGYFNNSESQDEILDDIESRIAELFSDRVNPSKQVITDGDVLDIIAIMGEPEDYLGEEAEPDTKRRTSSSSTPDSSDKKFFRDKDKGIVGGVCYGIAAYFNFDVVWVRIITVLLTVTGLGIFPYIVLWIIIPEAKTTSDKIRMHGDPVDIDSIKKKVDEGLMVFQNEAENLGKKTRNSGLGDFVSSIVDAVLKILKVFFKLLGTLVGGSFLLVGLFFFIFIISMFLDTPSFFGDMGIYPLTVVDVLSGIFDSSLHSGMFIFGAVLTICIPILAIVLVGFRLIFQYKIPFKGVNASLVTGWIIGIFLLIFSVINIQGDFNTYDEFSEKTEIQTDSDTLFIALEGMPMIHDKVRINGIKVHDIDKKSGLVTGGNVRLDIKRSASAETFNLEIVKSSNGKNYDDISERIENIELDYAIEGNRLLINPKYKFPYEDKLRGQDVRFILTIPDGKQIFMEDKVHLILDDVNNYSRRTYRNFKDKFLRMTEEGLKDLDEVLEEIDEELDELKQEVKEEIESRN